MKLKCITIVLMLGLTTLLASAAQAQSKPDGKAKDTLILSFSTVGDSRQDPVAFDPSTGPLTAQDKIWLQNSKAWSRIMKGVEAQKSKLLFFNGDMIMGYGLAGPTPSNSIAHVVGSDLMAFYRQYAFWRGMVAPLMESGTYVVPVVGNHEVQSKASVKKSQVENENAWRANMGDLIIDTARFKSIVGQEATHIDVQNNGWLDGLKSDQNQLTYSFDIQESHFSVVNTDAVDGDNFAPAGWLANDLASAKKRGVIHFFVFGHKPAYTYAYKKQLPKPEKYEAVGLDKYPDRRDAFWNVIEQYGATYFCGHEHEFNMMQPKGAAWQVLVGSGGSPWDAQPGEETMNPTSDRAYAWATVSIRKSGKVEISAYGFSDMYGPTRLLKRVIISR